MSDEPGKAGTQGKAPSETMRELEHGPAQESVPETMAETMESALRDAGLRMTRQRRAVLNELAHATDHPGAFELLRRVQALEPATSLSTVYRTLSALEGHGIVHRRTFEGAPARFEAADQNHHDHIVDIDTGDVIEFYSAAIEALQAGVAAKFGYEVVHHRMELYCRKLPERPGTGSRRGPSAQATPSTVSKPSKTGGPA
jgi:Fur family transcriptional regulator, ferric uptake regulator